MRHQASDNTAGSYPIAARSETQVSAKPKARHPPPSQHRPQHPRPRTRVSTSEKQREPRPIRRGARTPPKTGGLDESMAPRPSPPQWGPVAGAQTVRNPEKPHQPADPSPTSHECRGWTRPLDPRRQDDPRPPPAHRADEWRGRPQTGSQTDTGDTCRPV